MSVFDFRLAGIIRWPPGVVHRVVSSLVTRVEKTGQRSLELWYRQAELGFGPTEMWDKRTVWGSTDEEPGLIALRPAREGKR